MSAYLTKLFKKKEPLERDLDYVAASEDEIESEELKQAMQRILREIEPKFRTSEREMTMQYVRDCVYDTRRWRRVYNGLKLLEKVISIEVLAEEQREGRYFDVIQQCSLLMSFSHEDRRVTNLVRARAKKVRETTLEALNLSPVVEGGGSSSAAGGAAAADGAGGAAVAGSGEGHTSSVAGGSGGSSWPAEGAKKISVEGFGPDFLGGAGGDHSSQKPSGTTTAGGPITGGTPAHVPQVGVNYYQSQKRGASLQNSSGNVVAYTRYNEDTDSEGESPTSGGNGLHIGGLPPRAHGGVSGAGGGSTAFESAASSSVASGRSGNEDLLDLGGPPPSTNTNDGGAKTVIDLIDL